MRRALDPSTTRIEGRVLAGPLGVGPELLPRSPTATQWLHLPPITSKV